jgi:hypothetical protein
MGNARKRKKKAASGVLLKLRAQDTGNDGTPPFPENNTYAHRM